ncbi:MAG TPA: hypothetical protein VFZ11_02845 [Gemmatimonadaceae bacterium]
MTARSTPPFGVLAVEHAISETLGQGSSDGAGPSLELERASEESPDALPALPLAGSELSSADADEPPSGGPELPLLMPDYGTDAEPVAASVADGTPSSAEPLPWLAPPTEDPAAARVDAEEAPEVDRRTDDTSTAYEDVLTPRVTPAGGPTRADSPYEIRTIVGANVAVAEALERIAGRVRSGELRVPAVEESAGEAASLAAALAVLLGVRR